MTCAIGNNFRIKSSDEGKTDILANTINIDICRASAILDRLHNEFTEQYVATRTTGKTIIDATHKHNPTFFLRNQPKLSNFNDETPDATSPNRFHNYFLNLTDKSELYRGAVSAIMKGRYDVDENTYMTNPPSIRDLTNFESNPDNFKGIYGLMQMNEILETKIAKIVNGLRGSVTSNVISDSRHYEKRQNIKSTLKEIAYRENQIYREKFLNIILMIIGIFLVSTQLVQNYFSFGGGGISGYGLGGTGGQLSTRFGFGSGGIFSRFGGIGLGSSGRSRVGNLFTSNPYSLSKRE